MITDYKITEIFCATDEGTHQHHHWLPGSSPFEPHTCLQSDEHAYLANNNRGKYHILLPIPRLLLRT